MKRIYINYVNRVVGYINCNSKMKNKIKKDLLETLVEKEEDRGSFDPVEVMGHPKDVAKEFSENLDLEISPGKEYISKTTLFGIPLVHIVMKNKGVAKGIIAIGPVAVGFFSIGIIGAGIICLSTIGIGLLTFGAIAVGYSSMGAIAVANDIALGAIAVSNNLAIGAVAVANDVAIGSHTSGFLMYYKEAFTYPNGLEDTAYALKQGVDRELFLQLYSELYSGFGILKDWLIQLFI